MLRIIAFALLVGGCAARAPSEPARVLVFSKTEGYRHASIETGVQAIREIGAARGFTVEATEDAAAFTASRLSAFAAVVFLNTTGDVLEGAQETALRDYVEGGGGWVGVHAAADTEYDWPWYGRLVGAYFESHPETQPAALEVEDTGHPAVADLPARWTRTDEWYNFRAAPQDVTVLLRLDESSYSGGTMDEHPIAWAHDLEGGRAVYTGLGHTAESYAEPAFRSHLEGVVCWAGRMPCAR